MHIHQKEKSAASPFILAEEAARFTRVVHEIRSGDRCPHCAQANLDYDGMLNLSCPACGYAVGGCFT